MVKPKDALQALRNPLTTDFSYEWLDDNNISHTLTIASKQIKDFPANQYQFMRRHLADAVLNTRDYKNWELENAKVLEEITVEI